jgi:carboxylesterase type B
MKKLLIYVALLHFSQIFSQDLIYKKDIVYGKAPDWHNTFQNLRLDLCYPQSEKKFPLIVFVHGGGFEEGSTKEYSTPFANGWLRAAL